MAKNLTESLICLKIPNSNVAIITSKSKYFSANLFNNKNRIFAFGAAIE